MSIASFIPEIVRATIEEAYSNARVVTTRSTLSVDGDIAKGNALVINTAGPVTVQDYAAQGRTYTNEAPQLVDTTLHINQEKVTAQKIDEIDKKQAAGSLDPIVNAQGVAHSEDQENYVLGRLIAEGHSLNVVGKTPVTIDSFAKAKAALLALASDLDDRKVPTSDRDVYINGAFKQILIAGLSDSSTNVGNTDAVIKNEVAQLFGLTIIVSNDFTEKAKPVAVAAHRAAWAFAAQFQGESRVVPIANSYASSVAQLSVYGSTVVHPDGVAVFVSGGTPASA